MSEERKNTELYINYNENDHFVGKMYQSDWLHQQFYRSFASM